MYASKSEEKRVEIMKRTKVAKVVKPLPYDIHGRTCVHTPKNSVPCGKPCTMTTPHAWLCEDHEAVVNRPRKLSPQDKYAIQDEVENAEATRVTGC